MALERSRIRNPVLREQLGLARNLTAVNAVAATGTITFSGTVSDGETVVIGSDTYEFDTNGSVTAGRLAMDISGGNSATQAGAALVAAMAANPNCLFTGVNTTGTVVITAKVRGTSGNSKATTETCANGSWGASTTSGGVNGTGGYEGELCYNASYLYVNQGATNLSITNNGWKRTTLNSF